MAQHIICPFLIYVCAAQSWCQSERHSCPVNQEPCVIGQGWSAGIWFWQGARGTSPPQLGLGLKPEIAAGSRELVERCLDRAQKPNKRLRGERKIQKGLETGAELSQGQVCCGCCLQPPSLTFPCGGRCSPVQFMKNLICGWHNQKASTCQPLAS